MMHDAGKPLHEKTKVFLKHQLKLHGLTREEFAESFGCDERTVRRWESKGVNSLTTVGQLIEFFHASIRDVFPVGEDVPDPFFSRRTEAVLFFLAILCYHKNTG